tara:strand:+ start:883 stop:1065 length:183 start_codon:yes stop_codon:yes gene_type:complete
MYPDLLLTKQKRKRKKRWPPSQEEIDQAKAKFFQEGGQVQDLNFYSGPQEPANSARQRVF